MVPFIFILLCLIWGSTWMVIKIGIADAPPLYTAAVRFLLAVSILASVAIARKLVYPSGWQAKLKLGYPGIYMFGLSYGLIYIAEGYIDSSLTAVLFASFPFYVAILSNIRLDDTPIRRIAWLGIVLGFVGVLIISHAGWEASRDMFIGSMLVLGASFFAAYGIIIHKKLHSDKDIVVATSLQMLVGGVPLIIIAILTEDISGLKVNSATVGSLIYLAVIGSVAAFLMYYWLLKRARAITVSMIAFITPLVAILFGWMFMGERLSSRIAIGTVLILSGVMFVVKRPSRRPVETAVDHG